MRKRFARIVAPLKTFRTRLSKTFGYFLPRSHPSGSRPAGREENLQAPEVPTVKKDSKSPNHRLPVNEGHFVQEKRSRRKWPKSLHRQPMDEETFAAVAQRVYQQALEEGRDMAELAPWKLKLASRYALHFNTSAEEAIRIIVENRNNLRYIADEVEFEIPQSYLNDAG